MLELVTAQLKVTRPRGIRRAGDGSLFLPQALLTSRRLRSAGCSRMERLSRYCHRGLSSGGSRRFSRRDRHGRHRFPAGERVLGQGLGLQGARGEPQPQPVLGIRGLYSRSCPACGGFAKGAADSALLTQEEAGSEGGAQSGRAQGQRGGHREPGHGLDHGAGRRRRRQGHLCWSYRDRARTLGLSLLLRVRVLPAELRP